jgi:hypothetical protein
MSKETFCKILAFSILGFVLFIKSGVIYVGFAPIASYKLNEAEKKVINEALTLFREKVENEEFDLLAKEFALVDKRDLEDSFSLQKVKSLKKEYKKPLETEVFRVMKPYQASQYWQNIQGSVYNVTNLTKTENGEISETFSWNITENEPVKLLSYHFFEIKKWEILNRERDKYLEEKYPNQILINT